MTNDISHDSNLPHYANPPLNEVVFGVKYVPMADWKIPHVGAFWQVVRDAFPKCEHAPPIGMGGDLTTGLPVPRVWLISEDDDYLVQLQPDRFHFNWRRKEGEYPRFEALVVKFIEVVTRFHKFLGDSGLDGPDIKEFELTYINHVYETENRSIHDLVGWVVPALSWPNEQSYLQTPETVNWLGNFNFSDPPGNLTIKVNPARHSDTEQGLLVLELTAHVRPSNPSLDEQQLGHWFSHAHKWVVLGFEDITGNEAQTKLWKKIE